MIIRKPLGSILSIISTWLFILSLTGVLGLGIITEANENLVAMENVDPFEVLPPLPPGLTITLLSETPVIGEFMEYMLNLLNTQPEMIEPSMILNQLGDLFTLNLVSKPVIAAFFSLIGILLGKRAEHLLDPTITEKRILLKKRLFKNIAVVTLVLVYTFTIPVSATTSELYTENLAALITPEGQAIVAGVFAGNTINGIDNEVFAFEGFVGCIIASHRDILDTVYTYMQLEEADLSDMLGILPETLVVFVYIDTEQGAAMEHSDYFAHELSNLYEIEISELVGFTQEIDEPGLPHTLTVDIYQSPISVEAFGNRYLKNYQSYGGYIDSIPEGLLVPGKNPDSVDGSLLFNGYIKPDFVYDLIPVDQAMIPVDLNQMPLSFAGFIGYWDNSARVLDENASITDIFKMLDYTEASGFSSITSIFPDTDGSPILQLSTTPLLPLIVSEAITLEMDKMGVKSEVMENFEVLKTLTIGKYPHPLNLSIHREITQTGSNTLKIQIRVSNYDTDPAYDIIIDDSTSFENYNSVESIGNTQQEIRLLEPGETQVFEYIAQVQNQGSYLLEPTHISYNTAERSFETSTKPTSIQVNRPTGIENLGNTVSTLFEIDDGLSEYLPVNISTGIRISTYAVILYTVLSSVINLRKWILS
jgi:hypothetical protein